MKNKFQNALLVFSTIILFGCGSTVETRSMKPVLRAATDAPENFIAPEGATTGNDSCNNPLTDPRDGTKIIMQSAFSGGVGDYEVPDGKYGVQKGEFLRIKCATGEVVGIVRR